MYRAIVYLSTESMNPEDWKAGKECEGYDPDTFQDHGEAVSSYGETPKEALEKALKKLGLRPKDLDLQVFEHCIEFDCEGEHDYRVPKDEQVPFREIYSLYISKMNELTESELEALLMEVQ